MASPDSPELINLNTASVKTLTRLPGVGPKLARRIIKARPFNDVRDLIRVDGVGPRLYTTLLPLLTIEESTSPVEASSTPDADDFGESEADTDETFEIEPELPAQLQSVPEIVLPETDINSPSSSQALESPSSTLQAPVDEDWFIAWKSKYSGSATAVDSEVENPQFTELPPSEGLPPSAISLPPSETLSAPGYDSLAEWQTQQTESAPAPEAEALIQPSLAPAMSVEALPAPGYDTLPEWPAQAHQPNPPLIEKTPLSEKGHRHIEPASPAPAPIDESQPAPKFIGRIVDRSTDRLPPRPKPTGPLTPPVSMDLPHATEKLNLPTGKLYTGRSLYNVPRQTRWRILLGVFYGGLGLIVVGLIVFFAYMINPAIFALPTTTPTSTVTVTATQEPSATPTLTPPPSATSTATETFTSLPPTATPTITVTPTALSSATVTASLTVTASDTAAPSDTPTARFTATQTRTPTQTQPPTQTRTPTTTRTPRPSPTRTITRTSRPTPTPTATLEPTISATPRPEGTSPVGAGIVLFADSFESERYTHWPLGDKGFVTLALENEQYRVRVTNTGLGFTYGNVPELENFYYQATARVPACQTGDYYGLIVRGLDIENFYEFDVTCEGRVRVKLIRNNATTLLVNDPPHSAIQTGAGAVNVLVVRAVGPQFEFFVNGRLVTTITNDSIAAGKFGLFARGFLTPGFTVYFDDVFCWAAKP